VRHNQTFMTVFFRSYW